MQTVTMAFVKMEIAHACMVIISKRTALLKDVSMIFDCENSVCTYIFFYFLFDVHKPFLQ